MNDESDRLAVSPESALPHVILGQSYRVEVVAGIAASCPGATHRERVLDALALLAAAEDIANPDPWRDQHLMRTAGDGLGDLPTESDRQNDLMKVAREIVAESSEKGDITRKSILARVYAWAGRSGEEDARNKAFLKWSAVAAAECSERSAWEAHVKDHPERKTADHCAKWRKRWKRNWGKANGKPATRHFLEQFEKPLKRGETAILRDSEAAIALLTGDGRFISFLEWVSGTRKSPMMRSADGTYVASSDRLNERSRPRPAAEDATVNLALRDGS